jgi:hypothetical protein
MDEKTRADADGLLGERSYIRADFKKNGLFQIGNSGKGQSLEVKKADTKFRFFSQKYKAQT